MHVDDSRLQPGLDQPHEVPQADGTFDVGTFEHVVDVMFLAQEIVVGPSSYPTEEIGGQRPRLPPARPRLREPRRLPDVERHAVRLGRRPRHRRRDHRADDRPRVPRLGAGRRRARAVRALRREPRRAQRRHADAPRRVVLDPGRRRAPTTALLDAARTTWDLAVTAGEAYGYRNAQATVLAPTGTISFLMDCDTTGVEPDFSLVKFKELVGGGTMTIVNRTVPLALQTLGYTDEQVEADRGAHQRRRARSSAPPGWPTSTCRCSTWRSASARSRTWATSR